jgi:hypothetical protein
VDRERACQLFRTLLLIANRRLKSQQQSIEQHLLTLCSPTIDPSAHSNQPMTLLPSSSSMSSSLPSPASHPVEVIPDLFRNSSRSGSVCLIDPLPNSAISKGTSNAFPNVLPNKISSASVSGAAGTGTGIGVGEPPRRSDLEYRYPYKSFIPQATGGGTVGERSTERGSVSSNQNIYAMTLGNNVLLTTPTLVPDMIQVVLTRRKIEAKFNTVRLTD